MHQGNTAAAERTTFWMWVAFGLPCAAGISGLANVSQLATVLIAYVIVLILMVDRHPMRISPVVAAILSFGFVCLALAPWSIDPVASSARAACMSALVVVAAYAANRVPVARLATGLAIWIPLSLSGLALIYAVLAPADAFIIGDGFTQLSLPLFALHPNTLGAVTAIGMVATGWRCIRGPGRRWLYILALVLLGMVLLLTYSRSAILNVLVGMVILAFVLGRAVGVVAVAVVLGATLVAIFGDQLLTLALRTQDIGAIEGLSGRRAIWEVAVQSWLANPWLGLGYGEGATAILASSGLFLAYSVSTADNWLIDALVDVGILGGLTIVAVYILAIAALFRARSHLRRYREDRVATAELAVVAGIMLFHSLGSGGAGKFHIFLVLLVMAFTGLRVLMVEQTDGGLHIPRVSTRKHPMGEFSAFRS